MSSSEQPQNPSAENEIVRAEATVTLHRAPRYRNFMLLGAIVGVLVALILTVSFPETEEYERMQIFGFLLLGGVAIGTALGAVVALVIDRIIGRSKMSVVADRLGTNGVSTTSELRAAEPGSGTPDDEFPTFNEK
ncbi:MULTISPECIES: hypothetical protein [unclassified Cryobacterium]|uniref:hypothetical protein n=1 Tax=unclassified Cryobacterium TaxID=2649013 RepID=UPI001583B76D|nr:MULTISPECIES: hypothetical protein [unclassified Cryobacterium]